MGWLYNLTRLLWCRKIMCINYLIRGLVHDGCYIGGQVTFRPPATGSMTDQGHQFMWSEIYQGTGNQGLCRLLLVGDWVHQGKVMKVHSRQTGASSAWSLWLKDKAWWTFLTLKGSLGLFLASFSFTCIVVWRLSQTFLAPSSCSPQMFLQLKSLHLGVWFLENSLNTDAN